MVRAVIQRNFYVNQWVTCKNSRLQLWPDTFFDRRNKFLRYGSSFNFGNKLKSFTAAKRLDAQKAVTVLTTATGLANILTFGGCCLFDGFAISNLWTADIGHNGKF